MKIEFENSISNIYIYKVIQDTQCSNLPKVR